MQTPRPVALLFCFTCLLIATALSQQADKEQFLRASKQIQQIVTDVFRGDKLADLKPSINPGAYFIEGGTYRSLFEALYGKDRSSVFAEERGKQMSFLNLNIDDALNAAHMVAKTETSKHADIRYHSVFFLKSKSGDWQIRDWHTSK